jgi:hypothetical protein
MSWGWSWEELGRSWVVTLGRCGVQIRRRSHAMAARMQAALSKTSLVLHRPPEH